MNNVTLGVLAVATLCVGIFIGMRMGGSGTHPTSAEVQGLRDTVASLEAALERRGPSPMSAGAALEGRWTPGALPSPETDAAPAVAYGEAPETFDISKYEDANKAFAGLLAYAHACLAKGPEGHLELLEALNDTFFEDPGRKLAQEMVGSEEEAVRFLYPIIKFAMDHNVQVADMMETIYKTAAEEPARFEQLDDDVLEVFTEGIAFVIPGMVGEERMKRLTKYAEAILAQDAETQPEALRRNRRDIEQALRAWRPPISPAEAVAKLQSGTVSPEEINHLLRRVPKEMLEGLDLDALIGPMLEKNPFQVMSVLHRVQPKGAVRDQLDRRVIRGTVQGTGHPQFLHSYLRYTDRLEWGNARAFIESGLQQATNAKGWGAFAQAALSTGKGPDKDWIGWVLETYELPPHVRNMLEGRLK